MLVAPYITREVSERCRQLHLPFIDTAGNAYLEAPGLLVYVIGNTKPAEFRRDHFRALNPAGLQIVFALACQPALIQTTYREIAARAGVALGSVGPVMKDLEARGYLRFQKEPDRKLLDLRHMVEEWVTHYPITLRPKLNPRRFRADPDAPQAGRPPTPKRLLGRRGCRRETDAVSQACPLHDLCPRTRCQIDRGRPDARRPGRQRRDFGCVLEF